MKLIPITVIIPSKTITNLIPCIEAVRANEPSASIIVIDDGVDWNAFECVGLISEALARLNVQLIDGVNPFCFARNVNIGIRAAGQSDVVLLNDDALLESQCGFSIMQESAMRSDIGLVSASTNYAGNPAQHRLAGSLDLRMLSGATPGNSFPTVAFVCVFIPRRTIDTVGFLDDSFGGFDEQGRILYGWEDNDYCRRIHEMGLRIGVHDGCYVDHGKLVSSFRGDPKSGIMEAMQRGRDRYLAKWGGKP